MRFSIIVAVVLSLFLLGCSTQAEPQATQDQVPLRSEGHHDGFPFEEVDPKEIDALRRALDDEYEARAVCREILGTFGDLEPFSRLLPISFP